MRNLCILLRRNLFGKHLLWLLADIFRRNNARAGYQGAMGLWTVSLSESRLSRIKKITSDLCGRLRDKGIVYAAVENVAKVAVDEYPMPWRPAELASGLTGVALACGHLGRCTKDSSWDRVAHRYLLEAFGTNRVANARGIGLFDGVSGVAFAAYYLSENGSRYNNLIDAAERELIPRALALSGNVRAVTFGCDFAVFDVVSGLSGVGLYLLCRRDYTVVAPVLDEIVDALIALLLRDISRPAWHTPAQLLPPAMLTQFPHGNLNLGLAHGMPGMLAFLSLCRIAGLDRPRLDEAISTSAKWLFPRALEDEFGLDWPIAVAFSDLSSGNTQVAWCYGSAGLSRSLWLAATALRDPELGRVAIATLNSVMKRMHHHGMMTNPTFCHGLAGILQMVLRLQNDTGEQLSFTGELVDALISQYDPDLLLAYQDEGPCGLRADRPGILQGMAGILLVLLAASTECEPAWDRMFALS